MFVWFACTNFGFGKEKRGEKKREKKGEKKKEKRKRRRTHFFFVRTPSLVVL